MIGLIVIALVIVSILVGRAARQKKAREYRLPANAAALLEENVAFYRTLDATDKAAFEARVRDFLATVGVRGVDVKITDLDKLLVAAGAIIPIFAFKDWRYNNISEVLLYSGAFNTDYETKGEERHVLGLVGDGAMHRNMIISLPSLRSSFHNAKDGHNTAIHEFVHLIDKADGSTDGVPEYLLPQPGIVPWVKLIHSIIREMREQERSDINMYGATNDAEFFAVVAEYFFERPHELEKKHPELYAMLEQMFHTVNHQ